MANTALFRNISLILFTLFSTVVFAQTQNLTSQVDQSLTVKRIAVLPIVDNVSGIYANPLTDRIVDILGKDRRFEVSKIDSQKITPETLEEQSAEVQKFLQVSKSDSLLVGRLTKGPQGINIRLSIIGGTDMLPLTQERLENYSGFDLADVGSQIENMMRSLLNRLPYQAVVTSRQGQLITLNAGARHGLRVDDEIYAILITGVTRHPRFKFITKVDREIMGKVRLNKVEDSVSFGSLSAERTANLVQAGFKLTWSDMVRYPEAGLTKNGDILPKLAESPDAAVAFGDNPREWTTGQNASFGKVSLQAGLAQTRLASTHADGTSASGSNNFSPAVRLEGEMWLDPKWQLNLTVEQLATKVPNGLSGSSPDPINTQMQELSLLVGHNILNEEGNFWGPKFQLFGGFTRLSVDVDDTNPRAHTSKEYSSIAVGLGGSFPVVTESNARYLLGGRFLYHFNPRVSESGGDSGSASPSLTTFNVFTEYEIRRNLSLKFDLNIKQASTSFSGGSGSSSSANFTEVLGGAAYYF